MNYTLNICGVARVENPAEHSIREAVFALDSREGAAYLVLACAEVSSLEVRGDADLGFSLGYKDSGLAKYQVPKELAAGEVVRILVSFAQGLDDWSQSVPWVSVAEDSSWTTAS